MGGTGSAASKHEQRCMTPGTGNEPLAQRDEAHNCTHTVWPSVQNDCAHDAESMYELLPMPTKNVVGMPFSFSKTCTHIYTNKQRAQHDSHHEGLRVLTSWPILYQFRTRQSQKHVRISKAIITGEHMRTRA